MPLTSFTSLLCFFALLLAGWSSALASRITEIDRDLTLKVGMTFPSLDFEIDSGLADVGRNLRLSPHVPSSTFVGFSYGPWGGSFGFENPTDEEDRILKGESDFLDFQFRFYRHAWTYELSFQQYRGYFVENTGDFNSGWAPQDPYIQLPELATVHYGLNFTYRLNPDNYSLAAVYDHSARQLQSGGSWLLMMSIGHYGVAQEGGIIPMDLRSGFGDLADLESFEALHAGLAVGYGHTWVFNRLFASLLMALGPGYQLQRYTELSGAETQRDVPAAKGGIRIGLGYTGESYFFGTHVITDYSYLNIKSGRFNFATNDVSVYLGRHF